MFLEFLTMSMYYFHHKKGICALETLTTFLSLAGEMPGHEVFCQRTGSGGGQALGGLPFPRSQLGMSVSNLQRTGTLLPGGPLACIRIETSASHQLEQVLQRRKGLNEMETIHMLIFFFFF